MSAEARNDPEGYLRREGEHKPYEPVKATKPEATAGGTLSEGGDVVQPDEPYKSPQTVPPNGNEPAGGTTSFESDHLYAIDQLTKANAALEAENRALKAEQYDYFTDMQSLRASLASSQDEAEKLRFALLAQKYAGENQCFCEMSIGNPMYKTHSNSCRIATETLAAYTAARADAARKEPPAKAHGCEVGE